MCGSGTTNCEARVLGMKTLGLDLNPLSVLVAQTKTGLLDLSSETFRRQIENVLFEVQHKKPLTIPLSDNWNEKDYSYLLRWFDVKALEEVVQILNVIDLVEDERIKALLKLNLSNTVRAVSWQKVTDLRVRKEITEYEQGEATRLFIDEASRQFSKLDKYLSLLEKDQPFPEYEILKGDSRRIDQIMPSWVGKCDLLITSPPYATALPYIDTDRLSLVLLGLLPRSEHRPLEEEMIGNREVLESRRLELWEAYQERKDELPGSIQALIEELAETNHQDGIGFRRKNLPALLSKYYLDMLDAMTSAHKMMRPNSFAFYIVGNNSTEVNGERLEIPTDRFLWEIGERAGWHQEEFLNMELLPSRDIFRKNRGSAESILVFRSTVRRGSVFGVLGRANNHSQDNGWDFHDEDTQEHLHALHPYPARFIPQIPRRAIQELTYPGDYVLDPFCGGGTALLESILMGRPAIGVDNNAVAALVSRAKTAIYTKKDVKELENFLLQLSTGTLITDAVEPLIPDYKNRDYWFDRAAIEDLGRLRRVIAQLSEPLQSFALAVFSAIIVRVSHQDSDTRYARIEREYKPGSAINFFQQRLSAAIRDLKEIYKMPKASAEVYQADSRNLTFLSDNSVDLVVTSPPYLNAYDYHKYHRHRLHWIGGDVSFARDKEIGKHDTFTRPKADAQEYFDNMTDCFKEWYRVLKPEGLALMVIGDAIVGGRSVSVADEFLEILKRLGLSEEKRWLRNLQTTKKSFNQKARIDQEHVLLVKKSK
jgi:site-specific DNA-methyltransferase (cytosine-N4-specific)